MEVKELFKGVAVVIDDEIDGSEPNIKNIMEQIDNLNIPTLSYTALPSDEIITHFRNLSFLLLDWQLERNGITDDEIQEGVKIPSTLSEDRIKENIDFLKKFIDNCFCPVFIFSNLNENVIIDILINNDLYFEDKPNNIFIKAKGALIGRDKLFEEIENWLKMNPSVYVLKEWEKEYQKSKNKLFYEFQTLSPFWPIIMWNNFGDDSANKSLELGELISRNLHTRMSPFEFSDDILGGSSRPINNNELRRVLEGEIFIKKDNLHDDEIAPGDIFKISSKYFVNIRAACDCIPNRSDNESSPDKVELYLLEGEKLSNSGIKKAFNSGHGMFYEKVFQSINFPIDNGNAIEFNFNKLGIRLWGDIKTRRIGRLLPPYINRMQQRYALYIHRQDLPRIPDAAVFVDDNDRT